MTSGTAPEHTYNVPGMRLTTASGASTHTQIVITRRAERLEDLRPPAPVPDAIAVAPHVLNAARDTYLPSWTDEDGKMRAHCPRCNQGIADLAYVYSPNDVTGLIFAHMAQAHGWTRETTGE